jgi:hypothetical protein
MDARLAFLKNTGSTYTLAAIAFGCAATVGQLCQGI